MAKQRLSQRFVHRVLLTEQRVDYHDGSIPGFFLSVRSTGKKSFFFRYRWGKKKRCTKIGDYNPEAAIGFVTFEAARQRAAEMYGLRLAGQDPTQPLRAKVGTFAALCHDFLEKHARSNLSASALRAYQNHLKEDGSVIVTSSAQTRECADSGRNSDDS